MKYTLLTKEQFEALHHEFALFLASQNIDATEWKQLKKEKPQVAEDEMKVFSDVVWDDILTKTTHLEHFSKQSINLFHCDENEIHRIVVQVNKEIDLLEKEGFTWLLSNTNHESVEYFTGSKKYAQERNLELFDLIQKGSTLSKGELYELFKNFIA